MEINTIKTLQADMENKIFLYGKQMHYVQKVTIDEKNNKCQITTNLNTFDRPLENLSEFLKYWEPVTNLQTLENRIDQENQMALYMEHENQQCNNLMQSLNKAIAEVTTNKDYVAQAHAINNSAKTMVNLAKLKIDLFKLWFNQKS